MLTIYADYQYFCALLKFTILDTTFVKGYFVCIVIRSSSIRAKQETPKFVQMNYPSL